MTLLQANFTSEYVGGAAGSAAVGGGGGGSSDNPLKRESSCSNAVTGASDDTLVGSTHKSPRNKGDNERVYYKVTHFLFKQIKVN